MLPVDPDDTRWSAKLKFVQISAKTGKPATDLLSHILVFSHRLVFNSKGLMRDFAIPVPQEIGTSKAEGGSGWHVLPGASFAFAFRAIDAHSNTLNFKHWFDTQSAGFTDAVKEEVIAYFQDHSRVFKSFISIPIFAPTTRSEKDDPANALRVAVLNIHWDTPGTLNDQHAIEVFARVIFVYRTLVGALVEALVRNCGVPEPTDGPQSSMPPAPHSPSPPPSSTGPSSS